MLAVLVSPCKNVNSNIFSANELAIWTGRSRYIHVYYVITLYNIYIYRFFGWRFNEPGCVYMPLVRPRQCQLVYWPGDQYYNIPFSFVRVTLKWRIILIVCFCMEPEFIASSIIQCYSQSIPKSTGTLCTLALGATKSIEHFWFVLLLLRLNTESLTQQCFANVMCSMRRLFSLSHRRILTFPTSCRKSRMMWREASGRSENDGNNISLAMFNI